MSGSLNHWAFGASLLMWLEIENPKRASEHHCRVRASSVRFKWARIQQPMFVGNTPFSAQAVTYETARPGAV